MAGELDVSEEHLYELPEGFSPEGVTDGHAHGLMLDADRRLRFVWDGTVGKPFDELLKQRDGTVVSISDDGRHLAYIGARADLFFVGRDGHEDPEAETISGSVPPVFSADGAHLAYGAQIGGVNRLIVDGTPASGNPLGPIAAVFSPDGDRLALVEASAPNDSNAELRIVLDGVPGPWFRGMRNARGAMQFSPDGRHFAYYRVDGKGGGQWVVDDIAQAWFNDVPAIGLAQLRGVGVLDPPLVARFSPDGSRFAYAADVKEKGVALVESGQAGPAIKTCGWPVFSADGRRLAYTAETLAGRGAIVVDGQMGLDSPEVPTEPVFSRNGHRVAVSVWREEGRFFNKRRFYALVVDGEVIVEQQGLDCSARPVFSSDSALVAWWVLRNKDDAHMFLDGTEVGLRSFSDPSFSAADRLVYAGYHDAGGVTIVVDGRPGPRALDFAVPRGGAPLSLRQWDPHRLSPDGEHLAWAGVFEEGGGGGSVRPVLDDRIGPRFDQILNWSFDSEDTATWWAQRGTSIVRVRAEV